MGYKLKPVGKQLVRVVQASLSHNHYRVRVAALKAIRRLPHPPNFRLLTSLNLLFFKHFLQRRKKPDKKQISNPTEKKVQDKQDHRKSSEQHLLLLLLLLLMMMMM
jgi:hypothetical protein